MEVSGEFGIGVAGGFGAFLLVSAILFLVRQVERQPISQPMRFSRFIVTVFLLMIFATIEEWIFRWLFLGQGSHLIGLIPAFVLSMGLFLIAHRPNGKLNYGASLNLLLVGLVLGLVFWRWGIWVAAAAHFGWNLAEWGLGFAVSGEKTRQHLPSPAVRVVVNEPYGPEAHWAATIVLSLTATLILWIR